MRIRIAVGSVLLFATPLFAQSAQTPPVPVTPESVWYSGDTYPAASMRAGEEGNVSAILTVDAQGLVSDCRITHSSGYPLLDQATCRLAHSRGRFTPAKDAEGQSVPGRYVIENVSWRMKGVKASEGTQSSVTATPPTASANYRGGEEVADRDLRQRSAAFLQLLSGPPLPATLPVTPQRFQTSAPLWQALDMESGIRAVAALQYQPLLSQVMAGTASLPVAMQERARADFRTAYDAALKQHIAAQRDRMIRYFAARLDDQDIGSELPFLASGVGYKMVHDASGLTANDRQEIGRANLDRPGLAKLAKVQIDFAKAATADRQTAAKAFYTDVHTDFCHRMAGERFTFSSCPVGKH